MTTGSMETQEIAHAFAQWTANDPVSINGTLAIPAATAHVIADWIRPKIRWLCRSEIQILFMPKA